MVNRFNTTITALLDKHSPVTEITVRECTHRPWFDEDSRTTRWDVQRLKRQFKAARKRRFGTVQVLSDKWRTALRASRKSLMQRLCLTGGLELHHLAAILVICENQWKLYWVKSGLRECLHLQSRIFIIAWIRRLMTLEQKCIIAIWIAWYRKSHMRKVIRCLAAGRYRHEETCRVRCA